MSPGGVNGNRAQCQLLLLCGQPHLEVEDQVELEAGSRTQLLAALAAAVGRGSWAVGRGPWAVCDIQLLQKWAAQ